MDSARRTGPLHWECAIAGDTNPEGRNRSAIWFWFELRGVAGRRVTIDLTALRGEWNFQSSIGWGPATRPVFGGDGHWRRFRDDEVEWDGTPDAERLRLTFEVPIIDRVALAYIEPYTYGDHQHFIDGLRANPSAGVTHHVVGRSPEQRRIDLVTIGSGSIDGTDGVVWLIHRQHPWETYSSFAAEAAILHLIENEEARRGLTWQIVPMVNPDGCFHGHTRHNTLGKDPNREWKQAAPTPEVACVRAAITAKLGGEPVFFADVHNNDQRSNDYLMLTSAPHIKDVAGAEALVALVARRLASGSHFSGTTRPPPAPAPGAAHAGKPFSFPSALLEMRTGPLPTRNGAYGTIEDQRRLGVALVDAIGAALTQ